MRNEYNFSKNKVYSKLFNKKRESLAMLQPTSYCSWL